jgi:hypothetical protein
VKILLTPRRHAVALKPGEKHPTKEEKLASIADARRRIVEGLAKSFPQVIVLGIEGKGEIRVELPDSEPDLKARICDALDVATGPDPHARPTGPVWNGLQPTLQVIEQSYRDRLFRPTVVALFRGEQDRILMVKTKRKGEWGLVQGCFSPKRYLGCADINAEPGTVDHLKFTAGVRYFFFEVAYRGTPKLKLQKEELSEYSWVEAKLDDPHLLSLLAKTRPDKRELIIGALVRLLA